MNRIDLATKTLTAACLSIIFITSNITSSHAASNTSEADENTGQIVVEDAQGISQEEIATIDVLNEICPKILGENNNKNFRKGYRNLLNELLPSIKNPESSLKSMRTDPDYIKILDNARTRALAEKAEDNREICLEVLHYPAPKI